MKRTIRLRPRPARRRRGVTLVEMLVTVAVLVIIMTILVQVFQGATGALSAAQATQELDNSLKLLDATIRQDLGGATARFTPPLDPALNLGYFEYGENEFADIQGEDCDDYIRFTAKAPAGRPFTGRAFLPPQQTLPSNLTATGPPAQYMQSQPVTITSEYAEIIYFLRDGNLYRRVLLVAPELQSSIAPTFTNGGYFLNANGGMSRNAFAPASLGLANVSWQGVNDLSARPAATGPNVQALANLPINQASQTIVLNTLGDLTNRHNRFAYSRFANDFVGLPIGNPPTPPPLPDGLADDLNGDNVPDYYPTLYPGVFIPYNPNLPPTATWHLIFEPTYVNAAPGFRTTGILGFPFVFPGAYSKAQALSSDAFGWIHAPAPYAIYTNAGACNLITFDGNPLAYLQNLNHNPVDVGDNLPTLNNSVPTAVGTGKNAQAEMWQTWWGFPTWRETLSPAWTDPTVQVNVGPVNLAFAAPSPQQPTGLLPLSPAAAGANSEVSAGQLNPNRPGLLPAMTNLFRNTAQLFNDGWGDPLNNGQSNTFFQVPSPPNPLTPGLWNTLSWEDDLIMTGVRSFDIKAYDNALAGYGDLGWGDDLRLYIPFSNYTNYQLPNNGLNNTPGPVNVPLYLGTTNFPVPPPVTVWPPLVPGGTLFSTINQTFAHEGRMPPLVEDNRLDAQNPNPTYVNFNNFVAQYGPTHPNYSSNIGDDNKGVVRLRRVWDSWSTDYSRAPANGVWPPNATGGNAGVPLGPPFSPPVFPSYPPPYPAPLRGIQIQIRVVDPANQRVKSLTIRQDFTDKL